MSLPPGIGLLAKLAAILMVHADRLGAALWKRGVIDDPCLDRSMALDLRENNFTHFGQDWLVRPRCIRNKVQQSLMLHPSLIRRGHCSDRLNAPAALCGKKADAVLKPPALPGDTYSPFAMMHPNTNIATLAEGTRQRRAGLHGAP
jgi:hypothetical protein